MAKLIPASSQVRQVRDGTLTLTDLQTLVGGFIHFIELDTGDLLVINEASRIQLGYHNKTASIIADMAVYGDVVLCSPKDIA